MRMLTVLFLSIGNMCGCFPAKQSDSKPGVIRSEGLQY
jgi:hypothetical protein